MTYEHKRGGAVMNFINYTVATAAVTSPIWLRDIGGLASIILPIFGIIWLSVQIVHRLINWGERK